MLEFQIDIENIVKVLQELPKEKKYGTKTIAIARGKHKLKKNRFKWPIRLLKLK
jgi:hypothetical protein